MGSQLLKLNICSIGAFLPDTHFKLGIVLQTKPPKQYLPINTWKPIKGSYANSADPAQMPNNVASDQDLHYFLTGFPMKNRIKVTK